MSYFDCTMRAGCKPLVVVKRVNRSEKSWLSTFPLLHLTNPRNVKICACTVWGGKKNGLFGKGRERKKTEENGLPIPNNINAIAI